MEEIFESCHVPQQSRRNKLRVMVQTHQPQPFSSSFQPTSAPPFESNPVSSPLNPNALSSNFNSHTTHYHNTTLPSLPSHPTPPFLNLLPKSSCSASHLEYPTSFQSLQNHMVIHESQGPCSDLRNWVPIGPFTGYASILKRSRFLKPAQQLLEDLCGSVWDPPPMDSLSENDNDEDPITGISGDAIQHQWRDSKLACMLEEVYKKYALYSQHMQSVVESFQKVAGLGNATPYISFANNSGEKEIFKYSTFLSIPHPVQPILRSQRGLPDHAVALLKRWLFEHFLHPYPTDSEKDILAQQTGLSRCQVSNWFINARVRIWKPMVEEMHMLGEQQAQPLEVNHNVSMHVAGPFAPLHKPI